MTKRRASTYIPSEWSFYCPACKSNKHLEWNRKKEMIQCDACCALFAGPSCKYCPSELSRPHQLKYGRWRCLECTRTFIAKEEHVRDKLQVIEQQISRGELVLEKVSEEDKNENDDEESSESSTSEHHSHLLEVPSHSQDTSSDSEDHSSYPRSPRRKRGYDDMVTEPTSSHVHNPKKATATFSDIQSVANKPSPSLLSPPIRRKKTKRDDAIEQEKLVLRIMCPKPPSTPCATDDNAASTADSSSSTVSASRPIAINESSLRKHWGENLIRKTFPQFQDMSPPSPGTIFPLWMHLDISSTLFGGDSNIVSDPMIVEPSGSSFFDDQSSSSTFGFFSEEPMNTPPEDEWAFGEKSFDESSWRFSASCR